MNDGHHGSPWQPAPDRPALSSRPPDATFTVQTVDPRQEAMLTGLRAVRWIAVVAVTCGVIFGLTKWVTDSQEPDPVVVARGESEPKGPSSTSVDSRVNVTMDQFNKLQYGMSQAEIEKALGAKLAAFCSTRSVSGKVGMDVRYNCQTRSGDVLMIQISSLDELSAKSFG